MAYIVLTTLIIISDFIRTVNKKAKKQHFAQFGVAFHAKDYDRIVFDNPGIYKYTALLFDRIETDTREWIGAEGSTMTQNFYDCLAELQFDTMRDLADFKKLC